MGTSDPISLDDLARRAAAADPNAERVLFSHLRERFLTLAKRRVVGGDVEDVAQEALRVVAARYRDRDGERPILPWSLTVLRNVIGNHYQRKDRDSRTDSFDERIHSGSTGGEETGTIDEVVAAIARLEETFPRCGMMFRALLEAASLGGGPRAISTHATERVRREYPELSEGGFHVALHRCRQRLKAVLDDRKERQHEPE